MFFSHAYTRNEDKATATVRNMGKEAILHAHRRTRISDMHRIFRMLKMILGVVVYSACIYMHMHACL